MTHPDLKQFEAQLIKFGLTQTQAQIYLLLVTHQELRIHEIVKLAQIPRSSVYTVLKQLYELGIAEEVVEDKFKRIRPYSVGAMRHGLDEQIIQLQRLSRDLQELQKNISLTSAETKNQTSVRFYKHRSGVRQLYWNTLKAKDTVYVFSDWGRGRYVGMRYYENFVSESRARSIKEKVLINPTQHALESIKKYTYSGSPISRTKIQDIRVLDQEVVNIKGDTLIYNHVYAHANLNKIEISGFEIENPQFVATQRQIFDLLWNMAKPVSQLL